jgi:phosphomannomutase
LHADELQMIYDLYAYKKYTDFSAQGLLVCVDNFAQLYIDDLIEKFPALYQQSLDVVFDAGCAAASAVVPLLQNAFNWANAHNICTDTKTPLHEADPSKLKNIEHAIAYARQHKLQGVIAFDGDADRLVVATSSGCIFSGDELLAVFAQYTCASGDTIVVDSKTSSIVQRVCPGVRVVYAPTGAQEVMQTMHTSGAKLAGEVSGHYFFADRHLGYDDGIYASLRLLEIMLQHNVSLQELYDRLPVRFMSPEYRILVTDSYKQAILQDMQSFVDQHQHYVCTLVDGVRFSDDQGWALCRASNTESLLSIRFEGIHEQAYEKFKNIVMTILQPYGLHQNIK